MNLIDVTLRDGAHQVNFDWPESFYIEYIQEALKIRSLKFIELGYWKQTSKSTNIFYNMNESFLEKLERYNCDIKRFSIMVDYHYCSHNIKDFPDPEKYGIGLVRLCSRSEDIENAAKLGEKIKSYTNSKLSLNFFNITNYTEKELINCVKLASDAGADFIYFADTHGTLDLEKDSEKYVDLANTIKSFGIIPGFHLHDHSGKAYYNYRNLEKVGFGSTDVSLSGMGKGDGNLKMEYVINIEENPKILDLLEMNKSLLKMNPNSFGLITSYFSMTDYYGLEAQKLKLMPSEFIKKARNINGKDKDNFKKGIL